MPKAKIIFICLAAALPTVVSLSDLPYRFAAIPSPSDPASTWLVDTATGTLARCVATTLDTAPSCSPATQVAPGFRYDSHVRSMALTSP